MTTKTEALHACDVLKAYIGGETQPAPGPNPTPGPGPTPPPPPQAPPGMMEFSIDWNNPQRVTTRGAGPDNVIAVSFTTGNKASSNNLPHVNVADGNSAPLQPRECCLSTAPGDFDSPLAKATYSYGTVTFTLGDSRMGYGRAELNTQYWFNCRFREGAQGACDIDVDLIKADL